MQSKITKMPDLTVGTTQMVTVTTEKAEAMANMEMFAVIETTEMDVAMATTNAGEVLALTEMAEAPEHAVVTEVEVSATTKIIEM